MHAMALMFLAGAAANPSTPAPPPNAAPTPDAVQEIADVVQANFFSQARLQEVDWPASVVRAKEAFRRASTPAARDEVLRGVVRSLKNSHTILFTRDEPGFWAVASIYERLLQKDCVSAGLTFPLTAPSAGVLWKEIDHQWFVGGLFSKGPGEAAGLKLGDRVITADGSPLSPVSSFIGKAGQPVKLSVERKRGAKPLLLEVTPRLAPPNEEMEQASADSFQVLSYGGKRIAYLRVWVWARPEMQRAVLGEIARANQEKVDGFILDLRDGWGGADPAYVTMFSKNVPVLEAVLLDGGIESFDHQIRVPAALLVNAGTRSGKEGFARGAKKYGLAKLVGEPTPGAMTFGRPFCLRSGPLLYVGTSKGLFDGENYEGRPTEPDVTVPFDIRYAAGDDKQLTAALKVLASPS